MSTQIAIIGGKGTAINIAEQIVDARTRFNAPVEFLGYVIDDPSLGSTINGYPVLCRTTEAFSCFQQTPVKLIFALYKPERMKERVELLGSYGLDIERFTTFVHPLAYVSPSATVGIGNAILSHAVVQSSVTIGDHSIINSHVVIEHNAWIGSNNFVAASACIGARVRTANGVFVGLGATVREDVSVGEYAFVGMHSNVLKNVEPGSTVYGSPAIRPI